MAEAENNTAWLSLLQHMNNRLSGTQLIQMENQWQFVAYLPLEEVDWSIALVMPHQAIEAQLRSLDLIAWVAGGAIVTLIFAIWLWQVQMRRNQALLMLLHKNTAANNSELAAKNLELDKTVLDLKQAQLQLIQSEKMSSLGQLVAGIAHEINNPVNFIHGNLSHLKTHTDDLIGLLKLYQQCYSNPVAEIQSEAEAIDLEFIQEDLPKTLASIKVGSERIREIVLSLRNFSRMDESELKTVNIHAGIDSTLLILKHRLDDKREHSTIQVKKEYDDLPPVKCYAGQLNQVLMNLLVNAIDALEEHGSRNGISEILIQTKRVNDDHIAIHIIDNGPGIPESIKERLFEPFFTTKPIGKGTGLGLSISYKIIVEQHGGKLFCDSTPGKGTQFTIEIPIHQKDSNDP